MKYDEFINPYLKKRGWRLKENANFSYSYSGAQAFIADRVLAGYALQQMPKNARKLHTRGDIHIHDLNSGNIIGYCSGGDLLKLLTKGCVSADILSKPANHFDTAVDHIVNFFFMSQLEWAGAQAFSDFNTILSPFVYYDNLTYKQVRQSIQRLVWNLNFASRQAFQTPFTNLTFNISCPRSLRSLPVLKGGRPQKETYSEFQEQADMITMALCDVLQERDAIGRPFTFPIPTLNLSNSIDWDSPVMEKVLETSADTGSFYYMNYIGTGIDEDTVRAMCCRLNIDMSELNPPRGFWNFQGQTGSLAVMSLNMSRLGYLSKSLDEIKDRIDEILPTIVDFADFKVKNIERSLELGLMPFAKFYDINLRSYFRTIGVIGLNEMCMNLTGSNILSNMDIVEDIILWLRQRTKDIQMENDQLWNLELIPGEGSSYRLAFIDRRHYKNIKTLGTKKRPYYSTLVIPPKYKMDVIERVSLEEQILPHFTGGNVCRIYLDAGEIPLESMKNFMSKMTKTKIPYFDTTVTFGVCTECASNQRGAEPKCHKCGSSVEVYSRVVGYYRPVSNYNLGKTKEFEDRSYHNINNFK
jgi:ribonucleoside-triphosphate reductase